MSHRGLHKAFRKYMGQSPGRELRRVRIERAIKLLTQSSRDIKEIPKMCGFKSLNTFEVTFKQITGMSPGKYRSNYCKNVNFLWYPDCPVLKINGTVRTAWVRRKYQKGHN